MNLISEVLNAEAEYERRKAAYTAHPSQHAQEDEYEAEAILNELATTAAPKLARALMVAMEYIKACSRDGSPLHRDALAEIEREIAQ